MEQSILLVGTIPGILISDFSHGFGAWVCGGSYSSLNLASHPEWFFWLGCKFPLEHRDTQFDMAVAR